MRAQLAAGCHEFQGADFRGTITVSREAGARATPICEHLADYLTQEDESTERGWSVHDKDLVERIIEENHLPPAVEKYLQEDRTGIIDDYLAQVMQMHPGDWTLFHHTVDTIRKLARLGNAIVIGRGGNFITSSLPNTFHVRLIGSEASRVAYVQRSQNLEKRDAIDYCRQTDKARKSYVKSHLHKDIEDPLAYNAVIRTDNIADEIIAHMLGDLYMDWAIVKAETAGKLVAMPCIQ